VNDTADEVGTIDDCLYSIGNRIKIAKILSRMNEDKLLETMLEDIARSVQDMLDQHCIIRGN